MTSGHTAAPTATIVRWASDTDSAAHRARAGHLPLRYRVDVQRGARIALGNPRYTGRQIWNKAPDVSARMVSLEGARSPRVPVCQLTKRCVNRDGPPPVGFSRLACGAQTQMTLEKYASDYFKLR